MQKEENILDFSYFFSSF